LREREKRREEARRSFGKTVVIYRRSRVVIPAGILFQ
jgi:hypothetical protein